MLDSTKLITDRDYADLTELEVAPETGPNAQAALDGFGRTEDCCFSPNMRRLCIVSLGGNSVFIMELAAPPSHQIIGRLELKHPNMKKPHGAFWLDDTHLVIGNRKGQVQVLELPDPQPGIHVAPGIERCLVTRASWRHSLKSPGSVTAAPLGRDRFAIWACNNYVDRISYHELQRQGDSFQPVVNRLATTYDLKVPDGVAISDDRAFLGITNHTSQLTAIYRLDEQGRGHHQAKLRGCTHPHGLRFLPGGRGLIVADAAQPYLQVYQTGNDWQGEHHPVRTVRVLSDYTYLRGRFNPQEGGIKGIAYDLDRDLIATTCEMRPLTLFRLSDVLGTHAA